jgi:hypothetical protein
MDAVPTMLRPSGMRGFAAVQGARDVAEAAAHGHDPELADGEADRAARDVDGPRAIGDQVGRGRGEGAGLGAGGALEVGCC